jgi:hypothetical protein
MLRGTRLHKMRRGGEFGSSFLLPADWSRSHPKRPHKFVSVLLFPPQADHRPARKPPGRLGVPGLEDKDRKDGRRQAKGRTL